MFINMKHKGFAAVELTIILPILLLFFLFTVDYGRILYETMTTTSSARVAAGVGAQSPAHTTRTLEMSSMGLSDASDLSTNSNNATPVIINSRRFCQCTGSSSEISCSTSSCSSTLEVYVEVTSQRVFSTHINFPPIPSQVTITEVATIRAQ